LVLLAHLQGACQIYQRPNPVQGSCLALIVHAALFLKTCRQLAEQRSGVLYVSGREQRFRLPERQLHALARPRSLVGQ